RPLLLPRHLAAARIGPLPGARGRLQPTAVLRGRPDRLRARAAGARRAWAARERRRRVLSRPGDARADTGARRRVRGGAPPRRARRAPPLRTVTRGWARAH